jgi:ferredoxin
MKTLTQAQLDKWLDGLAQELTLVAPVNKQGKLLYREVHSSGDIAWEFERTDISPKSWLLPATEPVVTITKGEQLQLEDPPAPQVKVVFGVRPCDARAALAIDALLLQKEPSDGQYARHREATTLIGLSCPQMWDSCFCTVVGGAPDGTDGLDILLTELQGDGKKPLYAVQTVTEKGKELASNMPGLEQDVSLPEPQLTEGLPSLTASEAWKAQFDDAFWQQLTERCLACRACTFVCPACRCFDVRDEVVSRQPGLQVFHRLRAWDACTSAPYRRIAGGHNPRPTQHARLRNRFYCKFMYYPQDFGPLGCVGCGRCIDACPVNIDILEVIAGVGQLAPSASCAADGQAAAA